ncbi:MAG TPA: CheR family methyltransferase, partial [Telmatospirillum sp.]|nr:CheR family methyltransferase [Telmatospirillum sp.]
RTVRIAADIRTKVHFGRLNLMDEHYPVDDDIDIIFCRNILIYFDRPTQEAVIQRLSRHLRRGGYFFVGHTESIAGFSLPLQPVANAVFQRR